MGSWKILWVKFNIIQCCTSCLIKQKLKHSWGALIRLTLWSLSVHETSFLWVSYDCRSDFLMKQHTVSCIHRRVELHVATEDLALPCQELLLGRPFSQMSEICLASGILSLHEWDNPLDLRMCTVRTIMATPKTRTVIKCCGAAVVDWSEDETTRSVKERKPF